MPELKAYDVNVNGTETTLLLDADEAAERGLAHKDLRDTRQAQSTAAEKKSPTVGKN